MTAVIIDQDLAKKFTQVLHLIKENGSQKDFFPNLSETGLDELAGSLRFKSILINAGQLTAKAKLMVSQLGMIANVVSVTSGIGIPLIALCMDGGGGWVRYG